MLRLVLCHSPGRKKCGPHFTRAVVLAKLHHHLHCKITRQISADSRIHHQYRVQIHQLFDNLVLFSLLSTLHHHMSGRQVLVA